MEELYHLIEFLIQIVFVEHIYGLRHDRMHQGMVVMHDSEIARIRHGRDVKSIAKRAYLVLCSCEVPHIVRSQSPPVRKIRQRRILFDPDLPMQKRFEASNSENTLSPHEKVVFYVSRLNSTFRYPKELHSSAHLWSANDVHQPPRKKKGAHLECFSIFSSTYLNHAYDGW